MNNGVIYEHIGDDGEVVGRAEVKNLAGEGHIMDIAVHPNHRRQGIGEKLTAMLIDWCRRENMTCITLEVRRGNTAARGLYEKLGFVVCGERKRYYDNTEDAIIMTISFESC